MGPLSPHSVPGVSGGSDSGAARRHHSTGARTDPMRVKKKVYWVIVPRKL